MIYKSMDISLSNMETLVKNKSYNNDKALYEAHRDWLKFSWTKYTKEVHIALIKTYIYDERFTKYYYENIGEGATKVFIKVIEIFIK